jgi:hypothetical protein
MYSESILTVPRPILWLVLPCPMRRAVLMCDGALGHILNWGFGGRDDFGLALTTSSNYYATELDADVILVRIFNSIEPDFLFGSPVY